MCDLGSEPRNPRRNDARARPRQARRSFLLASLAGGWLAGPCPLVRSGSPGEDTGAGPKIYGDRYGVVTVHSPSGEQLHEFRMGPGVVRETFLLEGGRIACACQKNRAVFWDLSTGKEARRLDQRIYGFSPAEDWFFTDSSEELSVYSYPAMTVACRLKKDRPDGPDAHRISPDGHYLAVVFSSGRPSSDQAYPRRDPVYKSIRSSRLYDVAACAAVGEFSALDCVQLGEFTDDECSYILKNATISIDGHPRRGDWRFDLPSRSVRQAD